jgi:hypothetical protein
VKIVGVETPQQAIKYILDKVYWTKLWLG